MLEPNVKRHRMLTARRLDDLSQFLRDDEVDLSVHELTKYMCRFALAEMYQCGIISFAAKRNKLVEKLHEDRQAFKLRKQMAKL